MPQNRYLNDAAREARLNPNYDPAKCAQCGTEFAPYRLANNRFCSAVCRNRNGRTPIVRAAKACPECGTTFTPEKTVKQTYCGHPCRTAAKATRVKSDPARLEAQRAAQKAYSATEAYRIVQRSAKARRRAAEKTGTVTVADWRSILARFNNACAYCGAQNVKLTTDHVVPLAKGGSHSPGNVVPACAPCNSTKNDRDWSDRLTCP